MYGGDLSVIPRSLAAIAKPVPLRMWGRPVDAPAIEWASVEARLEAAEEYWLISVGEDGLPVPRPVWGVWLDERLLLSVGSPSHWKAVRANPVVTVHLPDPLAVVLVHGGARQATGNEAFFRRFVDVYNPKYSWSFDPAEPMVTEGVIEVVPSAVLAWTTMPVAECSADMKFPASAGRWTFG